MSLNNTVHVMLNFVYCNFWLVLINTLKVMFAFLYSLTTLMKVPSFFSCIFFVIPIEE